MTRVGVIAVVAWVGCGGGAPAPQKTGAAAPAATAASPAEECLARAGAKHDKRAGEPVKIGLKQILVGYAGAKGGAGKATRTREEACLRALEARNAIASGKAFADVVKEFSDEPGAATRDGLVGTVERGELVPPVADAAFELQMQDLSDVVESQYGFHLLLRTE